MRYIIFTLYQKKEIYIKICRESGLFVDGNKCSWFIIIILVIKFADSAEKYNFSRKKPVSVITSCLYPV